MCWAHLARNVEGLVTRGGDGTRTGVWARSLIHSLFADRSAFVEDRTSLRTYQRRTRQRRTRQMQSRFGDLLTPEDHAKRADMLLFGPPSQASRDLLPLLDEPRRQLAEARLALRSGSNLGKVLEILPEALRSDPSLNMEKVAYLRQNGREAETLTLASALPPSPSYTEASDRMWRERRLIFNLAVRAGNFDSAYRAVTGHGMTSGTNYVEAEFIAGWLALTKLKMPARADEHFAHIQASGSSPITLSRAFYWRGRTAESMGDPSLPQPSMAMEPSISPPSMGS